MPSIYALPPIAGTFASFLGKRLKNPRLRYKLSLKAREGGQPEVKRERKRRKRSNSGQRQIRGAMLGITFVVCSLMVALLVQGRALDQRLAAKRQQSADLDAQISQEEDRTQEITDLQEYMQSDEYLEQVAKDKLGRVRDGEIIFKESD